MPARGTIAVLLFAVQTCPAAQPAEDLPRAQAVGALEVVATFSGPMPTGVTVSRSGRIFVNFPRWGDPVEFTVAELKQGQPVEYPGADQAAQLKSAEVLDSRDAADLLVSVQSVVIDGQDRLWLLDTGRLEWARPVPGGPKLVGIDLAQNRIIRKIAIPPEVALPTTYLNDVRFDLRRGTSGMAFITDSSLDGPGAIIVVDLESGRSWRRLDGHPSTQADENFAALVEGQPFLARPAPGQVAYPRVSADGIALSPDGELLYYCPLSSRRLHSVRVDALVSENMPAEQVAAAVRDLGPRGFASDGLEMDAQGRLLLTDYEDNAILRRSAEGWYETLVVDDRVLWPDTLCVAADGYLYFTVNQLHRQKGFQGGIDRRVKPYVLFRVKL